MTELTEIGFQPALDLDTTNREMHCPKCGQLYALSFDHQFYCLKCHPQKDLLAMIHSLKQQLNNETEMRMYSESSKYQKDYADNYIEPKIQFFQEELDKAKALINTQQEIIAALIKKVKSVEARSNKPKK